MIKEKGLELTGIQYLNLFIPKGGLKGVSLEDLKGVARAVRRRIFSLSQIQGLVGNNQGSYIFGGSSKDIVLSVSKAMSTLIASPEVIKLPETKPERLRLAEMFVEARINERGRLRFIAPVCPDYGKGVRFYQTIRGGISPEAIAAINASKVVLRNLSQAQFDPSIEILVANTEDDVPEIIERVVGSDVEIYHEKCLASAEAIRQRVKDERVKVGTFLNAFGARFREYQYQYEVMIRSIIKTDAKIRNEVFRVGNQRDERHSQILGRSERDLELTIRYMAQYAALGSLIRQQDGLVVLMNYQTPNRQYFNAAYNKNPYLRLSEDDMTKIIPVMGTIAKR